MKTFYYTDELNDDFTGVTRNTIKIDGSYKYLKSGPLWKIAELFAYRIIMMPFAYIYDKIKFHHKIINKKVLKSVKGGYFLYGNHTLMGGDAFIPNIINHPKKTYTVVHPDNLSVKATKTFIELNGAMPIPGDIASTKNFLEALKKVSEKCAVQIYPEAHIWPFYTAIRPFSSVSFKYPVKFGRPCFCFTNTFHKKRFGKTPKVITYVDGPFYPDEGLPLKEREQDLRNRVYETMCGRSKLNTYEYCKYVKREDNHD